MRVMSLLTYRARRISGKEMAAEMPTGEMVNFFFQVGISGVLERTEQAGDLVHWPVELAGFIIAGEGVDADGKKASEEREG